VSDDAAGQVVNAIAQAGRTEEAGDGIVTVGDVIDVVRIRTGESGPNAL
jgi:nitrogen regulatory protein P-II 1